jgi:hypothetical protein
MCLCGKIYAYMDVTLTVLMEMKYFSKKKLIYFQKKNNNFFEAFIELSVFEKSYLFALILLNIPLKL